MAKYSVCYDGYKICTYGNTLKDAMLKMADHIEVDNKVKKKQPKPSYRLLTSNNVSDLYYDLKINKSSITYTNDYGKTFTAKRTVAEPTKRKEINYFAVYDDGRGSTLKTTPSMPKNELMMYIRDNHKTDLVYKILPEYERNYVSLRRP